MTADIELLPLPPLHIAPSVEPVDYPNVAQALMDYARANVAHATEPLKAEIETLRAKTAMTMGVGSGDGKLFVHGDYESIKAAQEIVLRAERLAEALKCLNSATRRYMEERPVSDAEWASVEPSVLSIVDAALAQEEGK